jgi:predicted nucleic acid-binding protein
VTSSAVYLDSSALVKLVLAEPESATLAAWLPSDLQPTSSAIARTELIRAVAGGGSEAVARARALLGRIDLITIDDVVLDAAALIGPPTLRTLDALHLASAMSLGDDLGAFVAYDRRLLEAAMGVGLATASPGV